MVDVKPTPGARIRQARNELGVSQKTFAARIGTARRRVIAWEQDDNVPTAMYLQRISAATGRSIDFFLDGTEEVDVEATNMDSTAGRRELLIALHDALGAALTAA